MPSPSDRPSGGSGGARVGNLSATPLAARRASPRNFLRKYVFSSDHKTVGKQYFFLGIAAAVLIGQCFSSWMMRIHLAWPKFAFLGLSRISPNGMPGGIMTPEYYLSLMTMHATLMVFFVLTTVPTSGFGTYFLPIQIGSEEMAFPMLRFLSFWIRLACFAILLSSFFVADGPAFSGCTDYPPVCAVGGDSGPGDALGQTPVDPVGRRFFFASRKS